ncbi:hypothetical protein QLQ12_46595 [Actinoplanes sp. NEAU-A12]|uniref:Uncharacterized protein n=1 Tax=Actinoplanes sandaracinus TaxID=3045177 RepID=A0ABT6X2J5_9ACTN|nr:hypothetical protein [Actinoplanes sandaracinus]MDI6106055.1 hypothetical protein [Actinoplanes sandaracinus]
MTGGRILNSGARAALLDGNLYLSSWLTVARTEAIALVIRALVRAEVAGLRVHHAALLTILDDHPQILALPLSRTDAVAVERMITSNVWDATAGTVAHRSPARLPSTHRRHRPADPDRPGRLVRRHRLIEAPRWPSALTEV